MNSNKNLEQKTKILPIWTLTMTIRTLRIQKPIYRVGLTSYRHNDI